MKRPVITICIVALAMMISILAIGQSQETTPVPQSTQVASQATRVTDPMVSDRLAKDLYGRNAATQSQTINWYQTSYGYTGNFAVGSAQYMARYDQQGNYVETFRQGQWNSSNVPRSLTNAFLQSSYKDQTVIGYWSVIDAGKTGYYLQLKDSQGLTSALWSDSQGNFNTAPYSSTTSRPSSIPNN